MRKLIEGMQIVEATDSKAELRLVLKKADDDAYAYPDYSGRAMHGKGCVGMVISQSDFKALEKKLKNITADSMGRDVMVYWKDLQYKDLSGRLKDDFDARKEEDEDDGLEEFKEFVKSIKADADKVLKELKTKGLGYESNSFVGKIIRANGSDWYESLWG